MDLLRPLEFQWSVNKRQTGEGLGSHIFVSIPARVNLEFAKSYSTDSFSMALRRFVCIRGTLSLIQSDRGEQLVAVLKQLKAWDSDGILE